MCHVKFLMYVGCSSREWRVLVSDENYILIAAVISFLGALIVAIITVKNQFYISREQISKDLMIQERQLLNERIKYEFAVERENLKKLHLVLSKIAIENSLTVSYIQTSSNMSSDYFSNRYLENWQHLKEAKAIADIYYQDIRREIKELEGQMSCFWGSQKSLLETSSSENRTSWNGYLSEVEKMGRAISANVESIQYFISERGKSISKEVLDI